MKYRIKKLYKKNESSASLPVMAEKKLPLRIVRNFPRKYAEGFDFGFFGEWTDKTPVPYKEKGVIFKRIKAYILSALAKIKQRREKRGQLISTSSLFGALCAAFAVAAVSVLFVLYTVLIRDYFTPYRTVSIPRFEGEMYPSSEIFEKEDCFSYTVSYEYSTELPAGRVISQSPPPEISRKLYFLQGDCEVELVVSLGERKFTMPTVSAQNLREVLLDFKNTGIRFEISEEYSSDVPAGEIISTTPRQDGVITSGETVKIVRSLGVWHKTLTVPNICSLSESRARALIESLGFSVGKVSYVASDAPSGTVISQTPTAHSRLYEGEAISFFVSTGRGYAGKKLPDLHGLSLEEATELLSAFGLTLGSIYYVESAASPGTVISQSPLPDTPITPDIYSIDIYVSN